MDDMGRQCKSINSEGEGICFLENLSCDDSFEVLSYYMQAFRSILKSDGLGTMSLSNWSRNCFVSTCVPSAVW